LLLTLAAGTPSPLTSLLLLEVVEVQAIRAIREMEEVVLGDIDAPLAENRLVAVRQRNLS
jgi:hypothetical protein